MVKLSIITLSYNTKDLTTRCLENLQKLYQSELENGIFEIIVVDNNSSDGSVEEIKNKYQNLNIIKNKENFGFAKGNNIGAKHAKGKYLFFLNSDTEVKDKGLLEMLMFYENHPNIGALGARLVNSDGTTQPSCGRFYDLIGVLTIILGLERLGLRYSPKTVEKVDWVSGGAMLTKKDIFEEARGFDENFFMYMEDMELCFRMKELGFATYYFPGIAIEHIGQGSSSRAFAIEHIYKGIGYFYKKHKSSIELRIVRSMLAFKAMFAIALGTLSGNTQLANTYKKAIRF